MLQKQQPNPAPTKLDRRAAALRENLRKRKEQAQRRAEPNHDKDEE